MTVLFLCGREKNYTRNSILFKALHSNFKVIDLSSDKKNYILRYLEVIKNFLFNSKKYDAIFIGFYGQPLVPLLKLMSRKPIVFDAFISTYQTLCYDRKKFSPKSLIGRLSFLLDYFSCKLANIVILDTQAHIDYFVKTYKLPKEKFKRIFVGAEESIFYPRKKTEKNNLKTIFFYCEYQPLHGVEYIVKAAKLLEKQPVKFILVGKGQQKLRTEKLIKKFNIKNIELIDWVPYEKLPEYIAESDICLGGHFGNTEKANMVIAGKTFQFLAMKKPTILSINEANGEIFLDFEKPYYTKPGNYKDLSQKINSILNRKGLAINIATEQYRIYKEILSNRHIESNLSVILESVI